MDYNHCFDKTARNQCPPDSETAMPMDLIKSLDFLITEASRLNMKVPARIIRNARSDIVHWAVNSRLPDDTKVELLEQVIDPNGFLLAIDLVAKYASLKDSKLKKQILGSLERIKAAQDLSAKCVFTGE